MLNNLASGTKCNTSQDRMLLSFWMTPRFLFIFLFIMLFIKSRILLCMRLITYVVAWACFKDDHTSLWRIGKFDPLPTSKPLNQSSRNFVHLIVTDTYLPACKLLSWSLQWFLLPICMKLHTLVRLFFVFVFRVITCSQGTHINFGVQYGRRCFHTRMCHFGVRKNKI